MKKWISVLLVITLGVLHASSCLAESSPLADLLGEWFEWRMPQWDKPELIIQADGVGLMQGRAIKWSYEEVPRVVVIVDGDRVSRWHYRQQEKWLDLDDDGANAERAMRGDMIHASRVLIKADSPMRVYKTEANQRPEGTPAKAPPSNPSQGAVVPHP